MHRYTPRWPEDRVEWEPPRACEGIFRDALDVIDHAAQDPLTTWYTYPWLWHLDESGRPRCWSKGSSLCDVQTFAKRPGDVLACRDTSTGDACTGYWLIIESRCEWRLRGDGVDEADAAAFIDLRRSLAGFGITLLDDVIVNERFEWWSLHELTSGRTAWEFTPPVATRDIAPLDFGGPRPHPRRRRRST